MLWRTDDAGKLGTDVTAKSAVAVSVRTVSVHANIPLHILSYLGQQNILITDLKIFENIHINPYPTAFPYGNGMVLHFYQQQESSTTKTVHKVINKGLKTYV